MKPSLFLFLRKCKQFLFESTYMLYMTTTFYTLKTVRKKKENLNYIPLKKNKLYANNKKVGNNRSNYIIDTKRRCIC